MPDPTPHPGGPRPDEGRLPGALTLLGGQLGYQVRLLARTPRAAMMTFVFPVVLLFVRHTTSSDLPASVRDSAVGGVLAFSVISTAFQTHASGLVAARELGVLKRLRGTPLPRWCYFAGRIAATCALALAGAAATLITAAVLGVPAPGAADLVTVLAVTAGGALVWAAVGTAATAWIPSVESAAPMLSVAMIPLLFFSGLFFPVSDEPGWLARFAGWLPARPFADAVAHAMSGGAAGIPSGDVLTLACWGAVALVAALRYFRWDPVPVTDGGAGAARGAERAREAVGR